MLQMLNDLLDDIQGILMNKLCDISLIMLCLVNKKYHNLVSKYGINNKTKRILTCHEIASKGYLEILKWARKNKYEWNVSICTYAAHGGHLPILKWLKKKGYHTKKKICYVAAKDGKVNILKWAKQGKKNYWDFEICHIAAMNDQIELLKWVREKGYPWKNDTELYAKQKWPTIFT
jgi:hypothetical protein